MLAEKQFPSPLENLAGADGQTVGKVEQARRVAREHTREAIKENTNGARDLPRKLRLLAWAIGRAEQDASCRALHALLRQSRVFCRSSASYPSLPRLFRALPAPLALLTFRRYVQWRISAANAGCPSPALRLLQHSRETPDIRRLVRRLSAEARLSAGIGEAGRTDQLGRRGSGGDSERCGPDNKATSSSVRTLTPPQRTLVVT